MFDALGLLVGLVSFSCDEDGVGGLGVEDGLADDGGAIGVGGCVGAYGFGNSGYCVVDDRLWVFGAGVVGGDDEGVGVACCGGGHQGSFGLVAVSATAKEDDESSWCERPKGVGGVVDGVGGVAIVDEDGGGVVGLLEVGDRCFSGHGELWVGDGFEAAWDWG